MHNETPKQFLLIKYISKHNKATMKPNLNDTFI